MRRCKIYFVLFRFKKRPEASLKLYVISLGSDYETAQIVCCV